MSELRKFESGAIRDKIDHIIPLSIAKNEEEVIKLCHYTNLQLLRAEDNIKKGNKINWMLGELL